MKVKKIMAVLGIAALAGMVNVTTAQTPKIPGIEGAVNDAATDAATGAAKDAAKGAAQEAVKGVHIDNLIKEYIVELVNTSRKHSDIYLGASPRGSLGLFRVGQALAALDGRDFVLPHDVKKAAIPVLDHRVIVGPAARLRELTAERIVQEIVDSLPVPGGDFSPEQ